MSKTRRASGDPATTARLLAEVLAAPDDDAPRAIYADHLIELGDPRGDFIAVQCELARRGDRTERQDAGTRELWQRFRELHSRHSAKWTKLIRATESSTKWTFHRGFVRSLRLQGHDNPRLPAIESLLRVEPVVDLVVEGFEAHWLRRLLDVEGIERLQRLVVFGDGKAIARHVPKAARLGRVRELRLAHVVDDTIAALARSTKLASLVHLAIGGARISEPAFKALAASPLGAQLETLEWCRTEVTPAMVGAMADLKKLRTFVASTGWCDETEAALARAFGTRFVIEREPSMEYLFDGVTGVSCGGR